MLKPSIVGEILVFQQIHTFVVQNNLFSVRQSGFRPHHITETAPLKVLNDIYLNNDASRTSFLTLLDLQCCTVDHKLLLHRLG